MTDSGFNDQSHHRLEASRGADAYRTVVHRLEAAAKQAGRRPTDILLLAVSKGQPAAAIEELSGLGQRDFGESYLQEALPKIAHLGDQRLIWHFIGPCSRTSAATWPPGSTGSTAWIGRKRPTASTGYAPPIYRRSRSACRSN